MDSFPAYLDFSIDISDIDGEAFTVVVRSDIGEARELSHFPFSNEDLERHLLRLENAILRSTDLQRAGQPQQESVVETLGRTLFDFILPGEARSLYNECLREAEHRHRGVRLKLSLHSPRLAALPWEFLYDPRKRDYVCLNPYTPLVRYTELPQTAPPLHITAPLRILGLLSDPKDMPIRLDVEHERDQVTDAVQSLIDRGLVELTWLEGNSWRDLQRILRSSNEGWHIFHFIGHGGYDTARNEGYIVLNNEDGTSHHLYASQLTRIMARQRATMRLVLLNACEGARTGTHDALSSTAATLITSGIPAVLAMQYEISNDAAVEFANAFYEALADNLPVDAAVAEARNALSISNARSLEWGVPVLHMRAADGRLFALQEENDSQAVVMPSPPQITLQPNGADTQANPPLARKQIDERANPKRAKPVSPTASSEATRQITAIAPTTTGTHSVTPTSNNSVSNNGGSNNGVSNNGQLEDDDFPLVQEQPQTPSTGPALGSELAAESGIRPDDLTFVISAAMDEHLSGDMLSAAPQESTPQKSEIVPIDKPAIPAVQTIEQLDEQLLLDASSRVQGDNAAVTTAGHVHRFYDEHEEDEEIVEENHNQQFHSKGKQKKAVDPFDIRSLLESYTERQHTLVGFDWVAIPAGNFLLGSEPSQDIHLFEDEMPQLYLYLGVYRISRTPVTNAQYKLFVDAVGHPAPSHWEEGDYPETDANYPVTNISWNDANAFCEWAGVRLPTEVEWEKASRGTDGRIYPWGDDEPDITRCNFDLTVGMTVAVGSYPSGASPYGVLDMAGNVWEWTATPWLDNYDDYMVELAKQPEVAMRRVLRGGGFRDLEFIRCASRSWDLPNQRYRDLGFRVVAL